MLRRIGFLLLMLLPSGVFAAEYTTIKAPFAGSDYKHLTKTGTIAEYWMDVDAAGNLIDHSGENLLLYSEQFDQAATWVPSNASATANAYLNPVDGLQTADAFNEGAVAGAGHYLGQSVAVTTGRTYTFSAYVYPIQQTDPTKTRHWIALVVNAGAGSAYFNLDSCTVGTASSVTARAKPVTNAWCRISTTFISASTSTLSQRVYLAEGDGDITLDGASQVAYAIFGAQFVDNTDGVIQKEGRYIQTGAAAKPRLDLTPSASVPTLHTSTLPKAEGGYWQGRTYNGTSQYFSRAHHDSMNIFDGDFTVTVVFKQPTTAAGVDTIFQHYASNNGIAVNSSIGAYIGISIYNGSGGVTASVAALTVNDAKYHVLQGVRKGDFLAALFDGTRSTSKPVAGYGTDVSTTFYLAGVSSFEGDILYFRIDRQALSDAELQSDQQLLMGYALGKPADTNVTFSRASTAYVTLPDGTLVQRMTNLPRVGKDGLLLEGDATNYFTWSQAIGSWTLNTTYTAVTSNTVTAPDGTLTGGTIKEWGAGGGGGVTDEHSTGRGSIAATDQVYYTFSSWIKAANRSWLSFTVWDTTNARTQAAAYYNVQTGVITNVTFFAGGAATAKMVPYANGWWRCSLTFKQVGNSSNVSGIIYVAEGANDRQFAGINQDSLYAWGAQFETGYHETSYVPSTGSAGTRSTDIMTELPYRFNTGNLLTGTETWYTRFDQDVATTGTVALGTPAKTFIQVGDVKHIKDVDYRDNYYFDGTGDALTITDSSFNPAGSFSVVSLVTPDYVTESVREICSKGVTNGNFGWRFYLYSSASPSAVLEFSKTGLLAGIVYKASYNIANKKPSFITATYTYSGNPALTDSRLDVYVDGQAVASKTDCPGPVYPSTTDFYVGASSLGESFMGKLQYLAYHNGTVLSQTDHNAAYAKLFEPGILPPTFSAATASTWIDVSFDAVCPFSGSTTQGIDRTFLTVGGNFGTAGHYKNKLRIYVTAGKITGDLYDTSGTVDGSAHRVQSTADTFNLSLKHSYHFYVNAADLGSSDFWVDGSNSAFTTRTNVAAGTSITANNMVNFRDTLVRYGQTSDGTTTSDCSISNLKIKHGN